MLGSGVAAATRHDPPVGQCGTGAAGDNVLAPARCVLGALADVAVRVTAVACGDRHMVAVTAAGRVITFGRNDCGQLGTGNDDWQATPVLPAGAALAGTRGPILLTPSGADLDPRVETAIARVTGGAGTVLTLGGDAAVRVDDGEEGGSLLCGDFSALNAALTTR